MSYLTKKFDQCFSLTCHTPKKISRGAIKRVHFLPFFGGGGPGNCSGLQLLYFLQLCRMLFRRHNKEMHLSGYPGNET